MIDWSDQHLDRLAVILCGRVTTTRQHDNTAASVPACVEIQQCEASDRLGIKRLKGRGALALHLTLVLL